uniref:Arf-GAP domain-containing protein n=1 Tax=Sus scrofa TaxID=9823 RepID=A0A8D1VI32_PIG
MAASAKRKQEEKHLKMLRDMTGLPHNRKCFDCDQRGPTYVNMTVGSFVCTSCSGSLRGLNPPHRVKSISMTTFTQQEIEFLQKHGNEVSGFFCLFFIIFNFFVGSYFNKYVPPEQAKVVASVHASISGSSASSTSSTPEVKPLKSLLGDSAPALHLNKGTPTQSPVVGRSQGQQQEKKQFDLLSDLGSDIFAAPAPQSTATANFANFAHFNSHAAQNSANADFANFDAFGQSSGSSNFGGFPTASHSSFQPQTTGGSAGSVNANFAHFDNFPKSSSADFGTFNTSQSHQTASAVSKVSANKAGVQTTDKYAALANLDNIFSAGQGGDQGSGFGATGKAPVGSVVSVPSQSSASSDKYAALAELDSVFSSAATSSNAYTSTSNASRYFVLVSPKPTLSCVSDKLSFLLSAATFGTASMSMPAGFGTPAPYSLPTSFSGSFQQPAFPAQAAFPQQTAFSQQPNGAGFAAFGQTKPVVTPFGQVAAAGVSSNPFMTGAPTGQFPTGSSSTNPFL